MPSATHAVLFNTVLKSKMFDYGESYFRYSDRIGMISDIVHPAHVSVAMEAASRRRSLLAALGASSDIN